MSLHTLNLPIGSNGMFGEDLFCRDLKCTSNVPVGSHWWAPVGLKANMPIATNWHVQMRPLWQWVNLYLWGTYEVSQVLDYISPWQDSYISNPVSPNSLLKSTHRTPPLHCFLKMLIASNRHVKHAECFVFLVYFCMLSVPIFSHWHVELCIKKVKIKKSGNHHSVWAEFTK